MRHLSNASSCGDPACVIVVVAGRSSSSSSALSSSSSPSFVIVVIVTVALASISIPLYPTHRPSALHRKAHPAAPSGPPRRPPPAALPREAAEWPWGQRSCLTLRRRDKRVRK